MGFRFSRRYTIRIPLLFRFGDRSATSATAPDPWFRALPADRIGGAGYGKGTDVYKFEKINRAGRKALAEC